ncbi:PD-(D/E)XK nuclease family protein [Candidatus Dojkabacteria bacterium]|uniref:PD-(D/E)XK nuclease family protein n=1 Tax=Candidatus Dojkabacteria bacterium TaxID=2099670 RepID=A0A955KVT4_9BACT|nr:PD-(D/E)XK nuclease family protein [Candidatus Dojkabacteria bacterium]
MAKDKYKAVWVSHSSISDFLQCPKAYYLKNVYKDPNTGNKIKIITPALTLGLVVHNVIESLSQLPVDKRFQTPLFQKFNREWQKVSGKRGGFTDSDQEKEYKDRGERMIQKVVKNPGPVGGLAVKIQMDLPNFWLSEEDEIILCGKVDWLEYLPDTDSVNIIDFKTSRNKEEESSLQLPIYLLLVENCQKRAVEKASYWYLETDDKPSEVKLPESEDAKSEVLRIAQKIKLARQLEMYDCPEGEKGCRACQDFQRVLDGEGELVGQDEYGADVYVLPSNRQQEEENREGVVL